MKLRKKKQRSSSLIAARLGILLMIFVAASFPSTIVSQEVPLHGVSPTCEAILSKADLLFISRNTQEDFEKSTALLRKAISLNSTNVEAYWKLSRNLFWTADAEESSRKAGKFAQEGMQWAERALQLDPQSAPAVYYHAMNLGIHARSHPLSALGKVSRIEKELRKCIDLDASFDQAGAHRCLARLYAQAPSFPLSIGNLKKAKKHALKAIETAPDFSDNYVAYAEVLLVEKNYSTLKEILEKAMELPDLGGFGFECAAARKSAKDLYEKHCKERHIRKF